MLQKLSKTISFGLFSVLFLTACYSKIEESDLPKACQDEKNAITTAEYFLAKKFGDAEIFAQHPLQLEKSTTNYAWIIRGTVDKKMFGGTYHAEIRMSDCEPLKLFQEE